MQPPWKVFPGIPLGSIGWRMGRSEDYWVAFNDWYNRKSREHRERYASGETEPEGWTGFYARKDVCLDRPISD